MVSMFQNFTYIAYLQLTLNINQLRQQEQSIKNIMNFFKQYHQLFDLPPNANLPPSRLNINNQLFIDKPYVQTYTQSHTLNSKLRALKKDYNQFQNQITELEHLEDIPKRSNSRRKQPQPRNVQQKFTQIKHHSLNSKNRSNIFNLQDQNQNQYKQPSAKVIQKQDFNNKKTNIFNYQQPHLQESPYNNNREKYNVQRQQKQNAKANQNYNSQNTQNQPVRNSPIKQSKNIQQKYYEPNMVSSSQSPQLKLLDQLKRKTQQQTQKLRSNQNKLWNKIYQEDNNVLKHSEINHVFNNKLTKQNPRLDNIADSTIPKMFAQNQNAYFGKNRSLVSKKNPSFAIRDRSRQTFNNRDKIVPQKREPNKMSGDSEALQRRKKAKKNLDQRKQKLKDLLRAFW